MTFPAAPRFLHVANGTCTTRVIEAAGIPGARSIWADPLYEGPVPGSVNDADLLDVRMRYLAGPADAPGRRGPQAVRRGIPPTTCALAPAISRFLQEYPWTTDGLSRTERRLLALANGEGIALWAALPLMHEGEQTYYVTDRSLAALAEALSRTSPRLLTLDLSHAAARRRHSRASRSRAWARRLH